MGLDDNSQGRPLEVHWELGWVLCRQVPADCPRALHRRLRKDAARNLLPEDASASARSATLVLIGSRSLEMASRSCHRFRAKVPASRSCWFLPGGPPRKLRFSVFGLCECSRTAEEPCSRYLPIPCSRPAAMTVKANRGCLPAATIARWIVANRRLPGFASVFASGVQTLQQRDEICPNSFQVRAGVRGGRYPSSV